MNDKVIQFRPRGQGKSKPQIQGTAVCTECNSTWEAVAVIETINLECPKCKRFYGVWKYAIKPEERFVCNCGNDLYFLTDNGPLCRKCGAGAEGWIDG